MKNKPNVKLVINISLIIIFIKHPSDWRYIDFSNLHIHMIYFYKNCIIIPFLIALLFFLFYSFFYKWAKKGLWITSVLLIITIMCFWLYLYMNMTLYQLGI